MKITVEEDDWKRLTELEARFQAGLEQLTSAHQTILENNADACERTERILARISGLEGEVSRINNQFHQYKATFIALGVLINERTS